MLRVSYFYVRFPFSPRARLINWKWMNGLGGGGGIPNLAIKKDFTTFNPTPAVPAGPPPPWVNLAFDKKYQILIW